MTSAVHPPLRIFMVENDADTRVVLAMYLEQLGHRVIVADSIAGALAGLRGVEYDLLIADIGLADGLGWDLLRRMAEEGLPPPLYAVAMTGYGSRADVAKSEAAGFQAHLVKPLNSGKFDDVFAAVRRELDRRQSLQPAALGAPRA